MQIKYKYAMNFIYMDKYRFIQANSPTGKSEFSIF